ASSSKVASTRPARAPIAAQPKKEVKPTKQSIATNTPSTTRTTSSVSNKPVSAPSTKKAPVPAKPSTSEAKPSEKKPSSAKSTSLSASNAAEEPEVGAEKMEIDTPMPAASKKPQQKVP